MLAGEGLADLSLADVTVLACPLWVLPTDLRPTVAVLCKPPLDSKRIAGAEELATYSPVRARMDRAGAASHKGAAFQRSSAAIISSKDSSSKMGFVSPICFP